MLSWRCWPWWRMVGSCWSSAGTPRRRPTRPPWPPPPILANWTSTRHRPAGPRRQCLGVASANGYTNDGTTSTVTVNISAQKYSGGPNAGTTLPPGYAEAIVTWNQQRFFSGIFGSGAIPVSARAVARASFSFRDSSRFPPRGVSRVVRGRMNQGLGDLGVWSAWHSNKRTLFPGWDSFRSVLVKCR